jgi:predicted amidohydrolase YtcJ
MWGVARQNASGQSVPMTSADIVITNARILTMNGAAPRAEAIAIAGNKIIALGSKSEIAALKGKHTRIIDAQMKTVMPGIIESHLHIFGGSVELDSLNINQISGLQALTDSIREHAKKRPKADIVIASGALPTSFGPPITRLLLDSIIGDRPFAVICFDHHTIWANTKALMKTGLLHGKALPPGNEIVMGADGIATGELREPAAYEPIVMMTETKGRDWLGVLTGGNPDPPATMEERAIDQRVMRRGIDHCASLGITSLQNMDGNFYQLELLKALLDRGELGARVEIPFHQKNFFETKRVAEALEMKRQYTGDMLHGGRVKIFMDGVLESLTALMLEDFPDHPGNRGAPNFTAEQFNDVAILADSLGLQISVHAIGDGGVRRTLDGYEAARKANGPRDSRHRIEHIEMIDKADVWRLKQLGVIASLQPIVGLGVPGNPQEPCRSRIAPEKLPYAYAWQTLRETGAVVAFSSDWPVSPLNPFLGMQAAMTSKPLGSNCPPQAQGLMDTLHSYTAAGAYCEFREDRKGLLQEGYLADVIVLDHDLEKTPAEEMGSVKPVLTICDGRMTFEG